MKRSLFSALIWAAVTGCGGPLPAFQETLLGGDNGNGSGQGWDASENLRLQSTPAPGALSPVGFPVAGEKVSEPDPLIDIPPVDHGGEELSVTIMGEGMDSTAGHEEGGFEGPGDDPALEACAATGGWYLSIDERAVSQAELKAVSATNRNGDLVFSDAPRGEGVRVVKVDLSTKNANKGEMRLLDPEAFYCVRYTAKNLNNFKITTHCSARLVVLDVDLHVSNQFISERTGCAM